MTTSANLFASVSNDQLIDEVRRLATAERRATASLIRSLMELDARRLYLREGCSSLFTYCTQMLHLAEGSAYNRIEVARASRKFPCILDALEGGAVTLTTLRMLSPHLTTANHVTVLAAARHKSKRDVEVLIATLAPRPAALAMVRKLPAPRDVTGAPDAKPATRTLDKPANDPEAVTVAAVRITASDQSGRVAPATLAPPAIAALAPERYKVQFTISGETRAKLGRVQDLLRHRVPNGDLADVFDRALTALLEDLERQRCAATERPRGERQAVPGSRHIPAAVRRSVWKRDDGRCAFVGAHGRCTERGFIEFHHVEPYALGGAATEENIQLRCRAHNAYEGSLAFGLPPDCVRETAQRWTA